MIFQTSHELMHSSLIIVPVLFEGLDLDLGLRELLIKFAEFLLLLALFLIHGFLKDFVLSDLCQLLHHKIIEVVRLFNEDFLNVEEVPVFANRQQQVVEKVVEGVLQLLSDFDYVRAQKDLVLLNSLAD